MSKVEITKMPKRKILLNGHELKDVVDIDVRFATTCDEYDTISLTLKLDELKVSCRGADIE